MMGENFDVIVVQYKDNLSQYKLKSKIEICCEKTPKAKLYFYRGTHLRRRLNNFISVRRKFLLVLMIGVLISYMKPYVQCWFKLLVGENAAT